MDDLKALSKSRLFQLKDWLTIPEAAKYLSIMFGEKVEESDVLHLALDRHLKLSANFVNHTYAKRGEKFLSFEEWEIKFREMATWDNTSFLVAVNEEVGIYFKNFDFAFYIRDDELAKEYKTLALPFTHKTYYTKSIRP